MRHSGHAEAGPGNGDMVDIVVDPSDALAEVCDLVADPTPGEHGASARFRAYPAHATRCTAAL